MPEPDSQQDFIAAHPDMLELLDSVVGQGFDIAPEGIEHLGRLGRAVDVSYWLCLPENREIRFEVHGLRGQRLKERLSEIADRLTRSGFARDHKPEDYLQLRTQAVRSGLSHEEFGAAEFETPNQLSATDKYLLRRKMDIRAGRRRR